MTKEHMYFAGGAFVLAVLWLKSHNKSAPTTQSGAGGPPSWTQTSGPMGAKWDPITGTVQMAPLYVGA